jgi:hypothetical protein
MNLPRIFNWELMANPGNWLIVALMVALPMLAVTVIRNSLAPPASS